MSASLTLVFLLLSLCFLLSGGCSLANTRFQRFLSDFIGRLLVNECKKNKCLLR